LFQTAKVVFVVDGSAACDAFSSQVATVVTRLNAELAVFNLDRRPQRDDAARQIADLCDDIDADIVMMAGQTPGIVRRLTGRSVLHEVLRRCRCAVWTAQGRRALGKVQFHKVTCAIDLGKDSARILSAGRHIAEQWGAGLSIVHALPEMDESLLQLAALNDLPVTLSPDLARKEVSRLQLLGGTSAEVHIATSDVAKGVKRVLRSLDADLLVIGPGQNAARSGVLGANVKRLVGAAPCPVLVLGKVTQLARTTSETQARGGTAGSLRLA
jgi:nucleotide-binding universal stress UspA family protein